MRGGAVVDIILVIVAGAIIGVIGLGWWRFGRAKGRCPIDGTVRCPHCEHGKGRSDTVDAQVTVEGMGPKSDRGKRESDV